MLASKVRFHRYYALAAAVLFAVEVFIAFFVRDSFVRPVLGDVLAVMLVYCGLLSIIRLPRSLAASLALLVGVVVEITQYLDVLTLLGLEANPIARIVLGTTFSWGDIVAYAVGAILSIIIDSAITARLEP